MRVHKNNLRIGLGVAGAIGLFSVLAEAQTTPPKATATQAAPLPDPTSSDPSLTTSVYGDWTLRCVKPAKQPGPKLCEVVLTIAGPNQQGAVAQLALGRLNGNDNMQATLLVPNNVALTPPPAVQLGSADEAPLSLAWQKCLPVGCFASASADTVLVGKWKKATAAGKLSLVDGGGNAVLLPVSNEGLSDALDALAKAK